MSEHQDAIATAPRNAAAASPLVVWRPQAPEGLEVTRVQVDEPRASRRSGARVMLAANSHVDLRSDGRASVDARVWVSEPARVTLRLHLYRADGTTVGVLAVPPLTVTHSTRWKDWRAEFEFPAGDHAAIASADLDFDDEPVAG